MLQFRIIPVKDPKYYHNQTMPEINKNDLQQATDNTILGKSPQKRKALMTQKENVRRLKTIQNPKLLPKVHTLSTSTPVNLELIDVQAIKAKGISRNKNNLQKVLGLLNIKKGSVSIQSQNVRVLEDEEEIEIQNETSAGKGGFFITEESNGQQNTSLHQKQTIQDRKDEVAQVVNEEGSLRKRLNNRIVQWKLQDSSKQTGFIQELLTSKKFMSQIGPGTYNLDKTAEVYPVYKHNPTSNFLYNTNRLQEMIRIKKQQDQLKLKQYKLRHERQDKLNQSESQLSIKVNEFDMKKRSKSQLSSVNNGGGSGYYKVFKNGQIKEANKDFDYYRMLEREMKNKNPNIRCELVGKQQQELSNLGPGSYKIESKMGNSIVDQFTNYQSQPQLERFHYMNKQLDISRNNPGPGFYDKISNQNADIKPLTHIFASFGSKEVRELKLVKEESRNVPGPGRYQTKLDLEEMLKKCEDKDLVNAILECTQDRKQNSVFKSKGPQTAVFNVDKKKLDQPGFDQFYTQDQKTISKEQNEIQAKRMEKIVLTNKKDYPTIKKELQNQIVDTFQTVEERFKDDKKLFEMRNIGPGSYYNEQHNQVKPALFTENRQNPQSSMFKSSVPRMDTITSGRDVAKRSESTMGSFPNGTTTIEGMESSQGYKSQMEKKSFNMKYNQMNLQQNKKRKSMSPSQSEYTNNLTSY